MVSDRVQFNINSVTIRVRVWLRFNLGSLGFLVIITTSSMQHYSYA